MEQSTNLCNLYPITKRWILKETIVILLLAIILNLAMYSIKIEYFYFNPEAWLTFYSSLIIWSVIILSRVFYLIIVRKNFSYEIIGDELKITRGFIFKEEIEYPLNKITAIQLKRNLIDFIFGISALVIIVPGDIPFALSRIPGLSVKSAVDLRRYLLDRN
jgi:membrane protein YdbS with pleckstrin-like domain